MTRAAYRIDGIEVPAAQFYAAACDPARSVVVEACAGAGKTWMLVSRILRALLQGTAPEQILAITFTRRAAGEMRERLQDWLRAFDAQRSSAAERVEALLQRGLAPAQAQALQGELATLGRRLQRLPRTVQLCTFHAWFAQLAQQLPLQLAAQLSLPAEFTLLEDPRALQGELLRRLRRRCHAQPGLRADHDALVLAHGRSHVEDWLFEAWRRSDEIALADARGVLEPSLPPASALGPPWSALAHPLDGLADAAPRWQALAAGLGARKGSKAQAAAAGLAEALERLRTGALQAGFDRAWKALFTDKGTPRQQVSDNALWAEVIAGLQDLARALAQQAAHEDHLRLVRLARVLRDEYTRLKRQRGLLDMADLERAAHALLCDPAAAGWVAQRLDQGVRQLLIDEFQDTSPLQWHALAGWLSAYAGAGGGASGQNPPSVFIVGDPKQSIYRFRRAEPRVFEAARELVVQGLGGRVLACDHTRRNAPALVEALNAVFDDAARADGWVPFRPHTTDSAADGAVLALPEVARPPRAAALRDPTRWRDSLTEPRSQAQDSARRVEAQQVARSIAALLRDEAVAAAEVMVLARRRAMLRLVADALAHAGVPCVMPESLSLAEAPEAQDLLAVLDVLVSPGHDLSLARALKSPLFACSDDELLMLASQARLRSQAWIDALLEQPPATPALRRSGRLLAQWRAALDQVTPHDLLDRIVHESDYDAALMATLPAARRPQARQVLQGLLRAALDHDGGRFVSPYAFVRAVRQGLLEAHATAPPDAVQLLTVHGAKGLEAEIVYLVDAQPEPARPPRATLLVDWPVQRPAPACAAFVAREAAIAPTLAALLDREQQERRREELNALYVAVTRARSRLIVSHSVPHQRGSERCWWDRLRPVARPLPEPPLAAGAVPATCGDAAVPAALCATGMGGGTVAAVACGVRVARLPVAVHESQSTDQSGRQSAGLPGLAPGGDTPGGTASMEEAGSARAAALGRAVHRLLEWIGQPQRALARAGRAAAAAQAALAVGLPPEAAQEVEALASTIADSAPCARFFSGPALRWAGAEVPVAAAGRPLRIDRLVSIVGDDGQPQWWVLDYKLHHRPQDLAPCREQLQQYREAVRAALLAAGEDASRVEAAFITGRGELVPL
jgi:ATP-dependent helicase/nuclease subunit A